MVLPTEKKLFAVHDILSLLAKLGIVTNRDAMYTPAFRTGTTYYHRREYLSPHYFHLIELLRKLQVVRYVRQPVVDLSIEYTKPDGTTLTLRPRQ
jgi:hypothetical protein